MSLRTNSIFRPIVLLFVTMVFLFAITPCDSGMPDRIKVSLGLSSEVGILAIGNHRERLEMVSKVVGNERELSFGYFDPSSGSVFGYTKGHPPAAHEVQWTATDSETVNVNFSDLICIPLDIWIVSGNFSKQRQLASDAVKRTARVWTREHQGFCIDLKDVHDETGNPKAGNYSTSSEGSSDEAFYCDRVNNIKADIGATTDSINVYFVDFVATDQGIRTSYGLWCSNGNVIALGSSASDHVLVHELGHAFSLEHIDHLSQIKHVEGSPILFDSMNVMAGGSYQRRSLTEGQTLRAVLNAGSYVNEGLKARAGKVTHLFCGTDPKLEDALCPPIHTRLWPDKKEDGTNWNTN